MTLNGHWFFYIVQCRDNTYYSGVSNNVEHRIAEHNRGSGAKYTTGRRPVKLVYTEVHSNSSEACRREHQVKGWSRTRKKRLIEGLADQVAA
jgi:putative endonuclease